MQTGQNISYEVSIIIPIYNGSALLDRQLTPFITWLRKQQWTTQIILVDDGSSDRDITAGYAREQGLEYIQLPSNKGKGAALRKGFQNAKAKIQLFTDADIPFQYQDIHTFVSLLQEDPERLVIGDRTNPGSVYFQKTSLLRNIGSNTISTLVNLFFTKQVKDTQCGLKGMGGNISRQLFQKTQIERFAIDIELIYLACKHNIPIVKTPVQLRYNDTSSVHAAKDGLKLLTDIFRIRSIHGKNIYK